MTAFLDELARYGDLASRTARGYLPAEVSEHLRNPAVEYLGRAGKALDRFVETSRG